MMRRGRGQRLSLVTVLSTAIFCPVQFAAADLADQLRAVDAAVLSDAQREHYRTMIDRDIERGRLMAIQRENEAWNQVNSREDWEQFRDQRIESLRESLGEVVPALRELHVHTTGRLEGEGYRIENLVFESRPGLFVTANLYRPAESSKPAPAIIISHSHHNPKTQGELQDMGMTWARQGWVVLVMDHLGHGERRQHPFASSADYPQPFRVGRQDYYFRYNVGLQLQLVGESLMGWMAGDLLRGVDLLWSKSDVDRERIVLIGAVAGGGDPAAVAAALDPRIAAVAPFNFGGPQPDYAIPENAEDEFYYFGVAYWESTRCLRLGGRDGFAHWVIAGSVAPRGLIYSHEFSWDRERDPVWPRLEKVYHFYDARDRLAVATGRGNLQGSPPESTHCNNVGVIHRRQFYPHWQRWFDMGAPDEEFEQRQEADELMCLTPDVAGRLGAQPVYELAGKLADRKLAEARERAQSLRPEQRRARLRDDWAHLLGDVTPAENPRVVTATTELSSELVVERILLEVERGIAVPCLVLSSATPSKKGARSDSTLKLGSHKPVVVAFARAGKKRFLVQRAEDIAKLIEDGVVVCLPDLRGTGETASGSFVGPHSTDTTRSCRDLVLGQTMLGSRLRDLRSVLRYVRTRDDTAGPVLLWGDSLAAVNPPERQVAVPHGVDNPNVQAEPSGGLLALLGALFESDVHAVYAGGSFASFRSLLAGAFLYVPHDAVIPGALTVSDVPDIAAALAPRPVRLAGIIDGVNRRVSQEEVTATLQPVVSAFDQANASGRFSIAPSDADPAARWLLEQIGSTKASGVR